MATYQEMVDTMREAMQMGNAPMATRIQEMIENKEYDEESSGIASAMQGIGQGATFGMADEIAAGLRSSVLDPIASTVAGADVGGVEGFADYFKGMGERYRTNLESQRDALEVARREDPWTTGVAEFAGGLGTGGVGAAKAVAGRGVLAGMRNMAGVGAGLGGVAGYGYGEGDPLAALAFGDTEDVKRELLEAGKRTGEGAAIGGTLGGAIPAVGAGGRAVLRLIAKPFTRNAQLTNAGRQRVIQALAEDAQYAGFDTEEQMLRWARKELESVPGMTMADLGPATRALAEEVAQTPTMGGRIIRETLMDRNKEQWKRMYPKLQEAFGVKDNYHAARAKLLEDMRGRADEFYTAGYAMEQRLTPAMKADMMQFKGILDDMNKLRRLNEVNGLPAPLPKITKKQLPNLSQVTGRDMDKILQAMDVQVGREFRDGAVDAAKLLKAKKQRFQSQVLQDNPSLAKARSIWSGDKSTETAYELGERILRDDTDLSAEVVRGFTSESERIGFLTGALRAFTRKLATKPETGDLGTVFKSKKAKEALEVALGGRKNLRDFLSFIKSEERMFDTFRQAVGNSATAKRLSAGPDVGGKLAALFGYTSALASGSGAPPAIVGYGARRAYESIAPQGRRLASERIQRGVQSDALMGGTEQLENLMRGKTVGGLLNTGVPQTAAGATGGLLGTGLVQPGEEYGQP